MGMPQLCELQDLGVGLLVHTSNPSSWEAGGSGVEGHAELHNKKKRQKDFVSVHSSHLSTKLSTPQETGLLLLLL